jgi:hypothetical protein
VASHSIPKIVRCLKEALTENERYAVADHVVSQLKEHGDPWRLSEEARPKGGPTTSLDNEACTDFHDRAARPPS